MEQTGTKHMSRDERLYNKIKRTFVENVDARQLMPCLELPISIEDHVWAIYQESGRADAAAVLLRMFTRTTDWFGNLLEALRNSGWSHIAKIMAKIAEEHKRSLQMVVEVELMDCDDGTEAMDVDPIEPEPLSIFLEIMHRFFMQFLEPQRLNLNTLGMLSDSPLISANIGCLEMNFCVKSLSSLHRIKSLYKGGALQAALTRDILSQSSRHEILVEAAQKGLPIKDIRLKVTISEEEFLSCEEALQTVDVSPSSIVLAYNPEKLQKALDKLPQSLQDFIEDAALLTGDRSILSSLPEKPVVEIVRCVIPHLDQMLAGQFQEKNSKKDLLKIGLNILTKACVGRKGNVTNVTITKGETCELAWSLEERKLLGQGFQELGDVEKLSSNQAIDTLTSLGWLQKCATGEDKFSIPELLRRDYLICWFLPSEFPEIDVKLYVDNSPDVKTDRILFKYGSMFLTELFLSKQLIVDLDPLFLLSPDVRLHLASAWVFAKQEHAFEALKRVYEYQPAYPKDADSYWKAWKMCGSIPEGEFMLNLVNDQEFSEPLEDQATLIEKTLTLMRPNRVNLTGKGVEFNMRLALRAVAVVDVIKFEEIEFPSTSAGAEKTVEGAILESSTVEKQGAKFSAVEGETQEADPWTTRRPAGKLQKHGVYKLGTKPEYYECSFSLDFSKSVMDGDRIDLLCQFLPSFDHITQYFFDECGLDNKRLSRLIDAMNPSVVTHLSIVKNSVDLSEGEVRLNRLVRLEVLDVEETGIEDETCTGLAGEIESLQNLKELNLGCNNISGKGLAALVAVLMSKTNLTALRVHNNPLGESGALLLGMLVTSCRHLAVLRAWKCNLGSKGIVNLSELFKVHKSVRRLSIRNNSLTPVDAVQLYRNLTSCGNLQFLDLNEEGEGGQYPKEGTLRDLFKSSENWYHLSLWNCNLEKTCGSLFKNPSDFEGMKSLTYLCLQENGLSDDTVKSLAGCLQSHCKYLQHLNLVKNHIGDDGCDALAQALNEKMFLEDLWLQNNLFSEQGAKILIDMCKTLPKMKTCYLFESQQLSPPEKIRLADSLGKAEQEEGTFVVKYKGFVLKI